MRWSRVDGGIGMPLPHARAPLYQHLLGQTRREGRLPARRSRSSARRPCAAVDIQDLWSSAGSVHFDSGVELIAESIARLVN